MSDRYLDPATEDFESNSTGGFVSSENIENMIAFSYLIPVGSWEGDPELGHRFAELDRVTDTVENRNRLRDLARDAVKWLVVLGLLERVDVTVESYGPSRVAFQVDYYTPASKSVRRAGPFLVGVGAA